MHSRVAEITKNYLIIIVNIVSETNVTSDILIDIISGLSNMFKLYLWIAALQLF